MAPLVLGSADVKLEEAIEGCDSRSGTEKVRLRQKLEQRRAGAAMEPRSAWTTYK